MNKDSIVWVEPKNTIKTRIDLKKQLYGKRWIFYLFFYSLFHGIFFGLAFGILTYFLRDLKIALVFGFSFSLGMFLVFLIIELSSIFHRKKCAEGNESP